MSRFIRFIQWFMVLAILGFQWSPTLGEERVWILALQQMHTNAGSWFRTLFIFPDIGNSSPNWLIFFRGVQTTRMPFSHRFHLFRVGSKEHIQPISLFSLHADRVAYNPDFLVNVVIIMNLENIIYMYIYMYIYIFICTYIYVYIYIQWITSNNHIIIESI